MAGRFYFLSFILPNGRQAFIFSNIFTKKEDQEKIRKACDISVSILKRLREETVLGNSPMELNKLAGSLCEENKVKPSFLGVTGPISDFPGNVCISVNSQTLHTIPFSEEPFKDGDVVKVDFGVIYEGFFTDHCVTVGIGEVSEENKRLIETAKLCVDTAVKQAVAGNRVGAISDALGSVAEMAGVNPIIGYAGHGIGKTIHEEPSIPYWGEKDEGPELAEGMLLCIENQITFGDGRLVLDDDGWTLSTKDGSTSAMFEHMVLVGKESAEVLTRME